jgi:hypothetical protein
LRLHQGRRRDAGFDELVRHADAQGPFFVARRQAGVGEMNMGECLVTFGSNIADAPHSLRGARERTSRNRIYFTGLSDMRKPNVLCYP